MIREESEYLPPSLLGEDQLSIFIKNLENRDEKSKKNYNSVALLKLLATLLSSPAGVPSIKPAINAAGSYSSLGYCFAASTVIAYGAGAIWIFHQIIDDLADVNKIQTNLINNNKKFNIIKHVSVIFSSVLTTIIPIFIAYKYNDVKALTIITIPISLAFNLYGFYKIFNFLLNFLRNFNSIPGQFEKDIDKLINYINHVAIPSLFVMDQVSIKNYYDDLFCQQNFHPKFFIDNLQKIDHLKNYHKISRNYYNGVPRKVFQTSMFLFPICSSYINFKIASEALEILTADTALRQVIAALIVIPGFVVDAVVTLLTAGNIFDLFFNYFNNNPNVNLFSNNQPKLKIFFFLFALIMAVFSSSNKAYVTYTTLSTNRWFFTTISIISSTIFEGFAQLELQRELYSKLIMLIGNQKDKYLLMTQNNLSQITDVMKKNNSHQYSFFFKEASEEINKIYFKNDSNKSKDEKSKITKSDVVIEKYSEIEIEENVRSRNLCPFWKSRVGRGTEDLNSSLTFGCAVL